VGRILQLTASYALSRHRIGKLSPDIERAFRNELRKLEFDMLPNADDFEALLTPPAVGVAWARRVASLSVWVLYRFDDVHVAIHEIINREPVGVD
jgi:hypothetical protein